MTRYNHYKICFIVTIVTGDPGGPTSPRIPRSPCEKKIAKAINQPVFLPFFWNATGWILIKKPFLTNRLLVVSVKTRSPDNATPRVFIGLAIMVNEPIYHPLQIWWMYVRLSFLFSQKKVGKIYLQFARVFNKTVIQLALAWYKIIIVNSTPNHQVFIGRKRKEVIGALFDHGTAFSDTWSLMEYFSLRHQNQSQEVSIR